MIYYLLCVISSLLIALAFASKKKYQDSKKFSLSSSFAFIAAYSAISAFVLLILSGFKFQFSLTALYIALVQATLMTAAQALGFACMLYGNMLGMSMFSSIGATVIPCVMGMAFPLFNERFSYFKIVGTLLLVIALVIPALFTKGGNVKNKLRYYVSCVLLFLTNGSSPLMNKLKTVIANDIADSMYQFYAMLAVCLYALIITAVLKSRERNAAPASVGAKSKHTWIWAVLFSLFICIGDYLSLVALRGIDISLQSPITMGLSVIFTAAVGYVFFKEKITKATAISIAVTVLGLSVIAL